MKKSLLALGLASALAGGGATQADVTVYGILDVNITRLGGDGPDRTALQTGNGHSTSRLGFRGSQDFGGGLRGTFALEAALRNDNPTGFNFEFDRFSYVGLAGDFGEITAGRHLTPLLFTIISVDPYIETFAGSPLNLGIQPLNNIRNSNSLLYTSPIMNVFRVRAMYTFGEQADSNTDGRQFGLGVSYTAGPLGLFAAVHSAEAIPAANDSQDDVFLGVTYTFPNNKIKFGLGYATHDGIGLASGLGGAGAAANVDSENLLVAATIPVGPHTFMPAYLTFDDNLSARKATQVALAYAYRLSKHGNFYASWADIDNKNGAAFNTFGALTTGAVATSEFNVGYRQIF